MKLAQGGEPAAQTAEQPSSGGERRGSTEKRGSVPAVDTGSDPKVERKGSMDKQRAPSGVTEQRRSSGARATSAASAASEVWTAPSVFSGDPPLPEPSLPEPSLPEPSLPE